MIKIAFLGDIAFIGKFDLMTNPEAKSLLKNMAEELIKYDYVIANLETPIAGEDLQYTKELYSFNSPVQFAEALKMTGVHCVTTANNHCLDRGIDGLKKTVDNLELLGYPLVK